MLIALRRQIGLADADFALFAGVDARGDLGAGFAHGRIVDGVDVAASGAGRIFRAEPYRCGRAGNHTASKAVAAVRCERSAIAGAGLRLHGEGGAAGAVVAGDIGVGVVRALRALGRVVRADFERIALVAPVAVVVARARVLIEVAIRLARRVVLAGNTAVEALFGVIAGA